MNHQQVLAFEPDHRNFCSWSSGRDWQCLYSSSWIRNKGMEVMFLEEPSGGWVRWNPSSPTGPLGEPAFFLLILPKLPFFYPVPSSPLLTCLCPTTVSFLPPAQSCCSVLTPLVTSALVSRLVSPWIAPLCHTLCVWHPQAHLLSQRDAQRHLLSQLFDFCLSLWPLAVCSSLASLALVCLSSGRTFLIPQRTSFRASCWGNTSFTPAHQILSSPWSLSPALLVTGPSCCLASPFLL